MVLYFRAFVSRLPSKLSHTALDKATTTRLAAPAANTKVIRTLQGKRTAQLICMKEIQSASCIDADDFLSKSSEMSDTSWIDDTGLLLIQTVWQRRLSQSYVSLVRYQMHVEWRCQLDAQRWQDIGKQNCLQREKADIVIVIIVIIYFFLFYFIFFGGGVPPLNKMN